MSSPFAGIAKEGTIEDVNASWGLRTPQRWTYMTPARTVFIEAIKRLDKELRDLQGDLREQANLQGIPFEQVPNVVIEGLLDLCESLCHSWSGEFGRDTSDYIKVVGAAKGQMSFIKVTDAPEAAA